MKKTLLTLMFICGAFAANAMETGKNEKTDTLSYITGQQIAHVINEQVIPQLKLDYNTIVSTIDKLCASDKSIKAEGITITPDNLNEELSKYFNDELQKKMQEGKEELFSAKELKIVSTLIGADFAYSLKDAPYPVEKKSLMKAIKDTHDGKEALTLEQAEEYMRNYYTVILPIKKKEEAAKWLANIEKQKGVKKTASGLLYRIEAEGDMSAKAVNDNDVVKVLYTGTTKEGKVFDSNRWADMPKERQEMTKMYQPEQVGKDNPIEFALNQVIMGWTEGMKLIGKGGRITLWIPAELAYGERGAGSDIGPNEALCFDVELLEVTRK